MLKMMNSVRPVWAPEGVDGGAAAAPASPESILFPGDAPPAPPAGDTAKVEADAAAAKVIADKEAADKIAADEAAAAAAAKPVEKTAEEIAAAKVAADKAEADKAARQKARDDWKEYEPDATKTDEENAALKAEHDKTKPADEPDEFVVPETYELTMPEGVELDAGLLEAVTPVFKDLFLTTEQAQALTDKFIEVQTKRAAETATGWANTVADWGDQARKDPEIGGTKFDATVVAAKRAIDRLGTPALKSYLEASGGGNHPEIIRILAKAGEMVREDNPAVGGAGGGGKPAEPAHLLFPNDAPKG